MIKMIVTHSEPPPKPARTAGGQSATDYDDFVIVGRRKNPRSIDISVYASPAGATAKPIAVDFSAAAAEKIRNSFYSDLTAGTAGRMMITQAEATSLGTQMSAVLFPTPVIPLFSQSLMAVLRKPNCGLRIRLALDASLVDLPWEYVYRPDHNQDGISGFLLLDQRISMVRESPNPRLALEPITGQQRLHFVGTYWGGNVDGWEVKKEFKLLQEALKPIDEYLSCRFRIASDKDALGKDLERGVGIFHYAGHCDFDATGRAYLVREMSTSGSLKDADKVYVDDLVRSLRKSQARLAVLSACNSGFWMAVKPLLDAEIPAVIGINGAVASQSTIEFCKHLYDSLCVGLTLDEAVARARVHVMQWGPQLGLFDWGLYMVYMPSPASVLFPRASTKTLAVRQAATRRYHKEIADQAQQFARRLDGKNFGDIMSETIARRVLILGRFTGRRLRILEAIKQHLNKHPKGYIGELFTYKKNPLRSLVEQIVAHAGFSRFVIADLSEPKSVQSELEAIVTRYDSLPVAPLITRTGKEYATFASVQRKPNVVKPTIRYRDLDDLLEKLDADVIATAEAKLTEVQPSP